MALHPSPFLPPEPVSTTGTQEYMKNAILAVVRSARDRITEATKHLKTLPVVLLTEEDPIALGRDYMQHESGRGGNARRNGAIEKELESILPGGRQFLREVGTIIFICGKIPGSAGIPKTGNDYDQLVRDTAYHAFLTSRNAGSGSRAGAASRGGD